MKLITVFMKYVSDELQETVYLPMIRLVFQILVKVWAFNTALQILEVNDVRGTWSERGK